MEFNKQLSFSQIKFQNLEKLRGQKPDAVVFIGMGGSGQVGDMVAGLKKELGIPVSVVVWKNCGLPETNFQNPLFIFVSFSGNTEEMLSGFNLVENKAAVCSGGKLLEIAKASNAPIAMFENPGIKPRQSGGYMFYGAVGILKAVFPEMKIETPVLANPEKQGESIAKKLKDKIALVYSSQKNTHIAYNWKTRLNETAKIPAFCAVVPEICHNEIEIFENKKFGDKIAVILIKDKQDKDCAGQKMEKLEKLFKKNKIGVLPLELKGKTETEKMWTSLLLADWVSYHLAKLGQLDPAATNLIDELKLTK